MPYAGETKYYKGKKRGQIDYRGLASSMAGAAIKKGSVSEKKEELSEKEIIKRALNYMAENLSKEPKDIYEEMRKTGEIPNRLSYNKFFKMMRQTVTAMRNAKQKEEKDDGLER